jgi:hypothetical protein
MPTKKMKCRKKMTKKQQAGWFLEQSDTLSDDGLKETKVISKTPHHWLDLQRV